MDAEDIAESIIRFLQTKGIDLKKLRSLGFDGVSTMSGCRIENEASCSKFPVCSLSLPLTTTASSECCQ